MKFKQGQSAQHLAQLVGATVIGNPEQLAFGLNEIHRVESGDIAFVDHPKYYDKVLASAADVILINKELEAPEGKVLLLCENPCGAFNLIAKHYNPPQGFYTNNQEAVIGENSWIAPNVSIGVGVIIGKNCVINPGVVLYPGTIIKDNVLIHSNTTIGANAFYYQRKDGKHNPMYSCGRVIIEDKVEIGANCTIDKGVSSDTIIGEGSKLDNMIHIGHDTILGKNVLMAAQSAIAGCVEIGNNVTIWGQVAISSGISIGDGAEILAKSGISKNCKPGLMYFGAPAEEARGKMKEMAVLKRLVAKEL